MKIIIYAEYNNGLGDLNFGLKIAKMVEAKYPDAEIQLVTAPREYVRSKQNGEERIDQFNKGQEQKYRYTYLNDVSDKNPDMIFWGPVLPSNEQAIENLTTNKDTAIVFIPEYDFTTELAHQWRDRLRKKGYSDVEALPTGIGRNANGIIIDSELARFDRNNPEAKAGLFEGQLPNTAETLLRGRKPQDYLQNTQVHVTINYSHNNAERLLNVHALFAPSDRDVDLIVMGETSRTGIHNDRRVLTDNDNSLSKQLLLRGFARVVYHEVGKDPVVILDSGRQGPTYRVVHTGQVSSQESINLRKIGGEFSGATGDQSLSEAFATSSMIVYETFPHKQGIVTAMIELANQIDETKRLGRAVKLLCEAKDDKEYVELAQYVNDSTVQDQFKQLRTLVINNKDFKNALDGYMDKHRQLVKSAAVVELRPNTMVKNGSGEEEGSPLEMVRVRAPPPNRNEGSIFGTIGQVFVRLWRGIGRRFSECIGLFRSHTAHEAGNIPQNQYNRSENPAALGEASGSTPEQPAQKSTHARLLKALEVDPQKVGTGLSDPEDVKSSTSTAPPKDKEDKGKARKVLTTATADNNPSGNDRPNTDLSM